MTSAAPIERTKSTSPIRLHDLCHGAASLTLAANVDIEVVSELPGRGRLRTGVSAGIDQ